MFTYTSTRDVRQEDANYRRDYIRDNGVRDNNWLNEKTT